MRICPLKFQPLYKPKIWGGRRLENLLGKKLDGEGPIGESWELVDLETDQSVVCDGPAKGMTLRQLVEQWGTKLIGSAELFEGRFPLLIKFLDATENLSVQVHPDEKKAAQLGGNVRVKHESWYVLHADAEGAIYRGVVDGVNRESFVDSVEQGKSAETLNRIPVKPGQCYYLPSGTVHALGAGVVVAEIQTPSDITYRVYDWDRVDPTTGKGRDLHIDEALDCIHFGPLDPAPEKRSHVASVWTAVTRLVACDSFIIERVQMTDGVEQPIPTGELIVWVVLEGRGEVLPVDGEPLAFERGDTVLIPAGLGEARIRTTELCKWLEVTIPLASDLADFPRPDRGALAEPSARGYVQLNTESTETRRTEG